MTHVGIDVHQKYSQVCELSLNGLVESECQIPTTRSSLNRWFGKRDDLRIVVESSGVSRWVVRVLKEMGHEVTVVNPRRVRLIAESTLKTDRIDAEVLARLSCFGEGLLPTVYQRSEESANVQTRLRVRFDVGAVEGGDGELAEGFSEESWLSTSGTGDPSGHRQPGGDGASLRTSPEPGSASRGPAGGGRTASGRERGDPGGVPREPTPQTASDGPRGWPGRKPRLRELDR